MAIYSNTQASLLAFLQERARDLSAELSRPIQVVNFDAYTDLNNLPEDDLIGLAELSMQKDSAIEVCSAVIMVGTSNDPNNMRLTKIVDNLYEALKPEKQLEFLDERTGDVAGMMICFNETIVLPVEKELVSKILQGVAFMCGVHNEA